MAKQYVTDNPADEHVSSKRPWVKWLSLANGEAGVPFISPGTADKTVQVTGTFGSGGNVIMEGSIDGGVIYFQLKDPLGNNLSFSLADGETISQNVIHIRPRVTAGDGSTAINVYILGNSPT